MEKYILKYKEIIISFLLLFIIHFITTLFFIYETGIRNINDIWLNNIIKDIIFIYSYISTWLIITNENFINIIFSIIYNLFIIILLFNMSNITKKNIYKIVILFSIIVSFYWYTSLLNFMSV